jgi:hypothetical protein
MSRVRLPRLYKNSIPSSIRGCACKCPKIAKLKHGRSSNKYFTSPFVEEYERFHLDSHELILGLSTGGFRSISR